MPQTTKEWNVLSDDVSKGIIEVSSLLTSSVMSVGNGRWGSAMFGSAQILGGGQRSTYYSNIIKNVTSADLSWNADRRLTPLFISVMTSRSGMWGEAMFGDVTLLGAGALNYFEG